MKDFNKIEDLRVNLNKTLDPRVKEYVEAELEYNSEIANGYIAADLIAAERRLIAAIQSLIAK